MGRIIGVGGIIFVGATVGGMVGGIEVAVGLGGLIVFVGGGGLGVLGGLGVEVGPGRSGWVLVITGFGEGGIEVDVEEGEGEAVPVEKKNMGVVSTCWAACTVNAETVFRLETARSIMLAGSRTIGVAW